MNTMTEETKAIVYRERQLRVMPHGVKYAIAIELDLETAEAVTVADLERYLVRQDWRQARRHGMDPITVTAERHEFEASQI
jgi:hypothetical protein|tara:strand:+ start:1530 stop:1772 length:243 start_codon:yes stop_codon:yes gene_type:complete